jgi:catechol 2,3-dioxygenase-like lactoylglutathione lyase family enzyme
MSFSVEQMDHVEVFVRDREAAAGWYERVLGLREVRRWDPGPVMIGGGATMIALFKARHDGDDNSDDNTQPPLRWRRVAWLVAPDEFDSAQAHLRSCGVAYEGPIDHDGPFSIYFSDIDGNPLEITCYPE